MPADLALDIVIPGLNKISLINEQIVSFVYQESIDGCAVYAVNLQGENFKQLDSAIKRDGGSGTTFQFRYGLINDIPEPASTKNLSDWKTLELLYSAKRPAGSTMRFSLRGLCHGNVLRRHRFKDGVFKDSISNIAKTLITDAGLKIDTVPTTGTYNISNGSSPTGSFIKNNLLPLASSTAGADWRFWVRNGDTVVFRPTDLSVVSNIKMTDNTDAHSPNFLHLQVPELIKDTLHQPDRNDGKIEVRSVDSLRVTSKGPSVNDITISDNNSGFRQLTSGRPSARDKVSKTIPTFRNNKRNVDLQTRDASLKEGQNRWSMNARSLYRLIGRVPFTAGVRPGILVNVLLQRTFGEVDINSGPWLVHTVRSVCTHGQLKSIVLLEKRWEK